MYCGLLRGMARPPALNAVEQLSMDEHNPPHRCMAEISARSAGRNFSLGISIDVNLARHKN
jgi:hypothetical protein